MMISMSTASRVVRTGLQRRWLHASRARLAVSNLQMPAMSPTMTEGGIASWKKGEGEAFAAGDVLLEIETDKATIDVEAQDDGVLAKIIAPDGTKNIPVGKVIALLAEEGDDLSNLEIPKDEPKSSAPPPSQSAPSPSSSSAPPTTAAKSSSSAQTPSGSHPHKLPTHSRPLFPSVLRLLQENDVPDPEKIKGTGVRGMLTKGDVLAYLGKASSPSGTYKEESKSDSKPGSKSEKPKEKPTLDGAAIRKLIVSSFLDASKPKPAPTGAADFDSIIADYLPESKTTAAKKTDVPPAAPKTASADFLDGLV
ncbi:single hybrid motif-containing protein [Punctularia strigosozonata HHB-11173 SS5]|uniref:single hybrid motif-containing protein n=1 Tax=Punctularia strigosozonata (strain HHB-11173) TaxID=741275 RepID=UPI0004417FDD|nr:single hybrid motif-containing protein [Punctularia strigosozonata HHB-11173 SS5]EIN08017.1 single hybrid motif-containing protein [Punctularia strigosozonata HHB-11173 SS5]